MADVLPALIGIGGVAVGGAIQWVAATRAQRIQFMLEVNTERKEYYVRVLRAATELHDAYANSRDLSLGRAETNERIAKAAGEWQEVVMTRYLSTSPRVNGAVERLDLSRKNLNNFLSMSSWQDAGAVLDDDYRGSFLHLKSAIVLAVTENNAAAMMQMTHFWNGLTRYAIWSGRRKARERFGKYDSETVAES